MTVALALALAATARSEAADVVVVGSGAAGLSAALGLTEAGAEVTLVTKDGLGDGSTAWAQGGLAAAIDPADSLRAHTEDTLVAGAGLCEAPVVAQLAAAAPGVIERLLALGVAFDREPAGALHLGLEGGHRIRRVVHAGGDASGAAVAAALAAAVRDCGARVREHALVVDLLTNDGGRACGVRLLDADGVGELRAGAVVLATGGIGRAWPVTSNPPSATGDGLALALRAGAVIRDAEFVQFHPTVLVAGGDRAALVSEAVRGEGARLLDVRGRPVMDDEHPLGDLAPRDVVAAAIHRRIRATASDHVLLDATRFGDAAWRTRFPTILGLCLARGIDPRTEPMPVAPAAHYACGGVLSDLDGTTSVPGLYAIGEVASTGVQGANRLASNGVTEALVAGRRVAGRIAADRLGDPGAELPRPPMALVDARERSAVAALTGAGSGVLRDEAGLRAQLRGLEEIRRRDVGRAPTRADVEASNLHAVSTLVATAALARSESRGCHRRADFPEASARAPAHGLFALDDDGLAPVGPPAKVAA